MIHKKREQNNLHPLAEIDQIIHAPARLMILSYLYVVENADFIFLMHMTGHTWGSLSTHLRKLESAGYVKIEKTFKGRKPNTIIFLSKHGRTAFREYKNNLKQVLDDLPD